MLAGAVALGFTLTTTARADEPFLSPKAASLRHDSRTVPSTGARPNLVSGSYLGAAAKLNRTSAAPGGMDSPNLVSGNYLGAGAKNPYPRPVFEIAPVAVKSGKACAADCAKDCCAKK